MKSIFKIGDRVIFTWSNAECGGIPFRLGLIINVSQNGTYSILYKDDYRFNVSKEPGVGEYSYDGFKVRIIDDIEQVRNEIIEYYEKAITHKKSELKTVSDEEKDKQKLERYLDIKNRIIRNCEWLIKTDLDDEDFINRVKEISNLKKQLFSPDKLPVTNEVHKYNGTIKYEIRGLQSELKKRLDGLAYESIEKFYSSI
ncbi:MAG: hypothetical protein LUH21_04625 [Clostridiales bacterium]|nr:hypothetical protein [Clostridiales bacterium]